MEKRAQVAAAIQQTGGKIFRVTFIKKDGTIRQMVARTEVQKGVNGTGMSYDPAPRGLMPIYDMQKDGWRMVNLDTVREIAFQGETHTFNEN
jgi:hypothetical protein